MASEEIVARFRNPSMPLAARLDAARQIANELERSAAIVRSEAQDLVAESSLDEDTVAILYWDYEDIVPAKLLGNFHQLRELLADRCPWTYPCPACGADQSITSRSALKALRKLVDSGQQISSHYWCRECVTAHHAQRNVEFREREAEYRRRLRELKTMPYREYLQTPEWQERRKARLKAARYACQVCNTRTKLLNVHHRTYVRRGEEYARDLVVLCEDCHHLFHRNGSLAPHDRGED